MINSTFYEEVITPSYGQIATSKFAEAMSWLSEERENSSLSDYVDSAQAFLIVLCKDLEEHLDITDCLSIIHNVYMFIASHNKKYHEEIGDIIEGIARKEKACSEEKD